MNSFAKTSFAAALTALCLVVSAQPAGADDDPLRTLTGEWWQLMLSIPPAENPILDPTGAQCMVGQHGPLWLLAGSFGGEVTRTCTVPAGKVLFFPVINFVFFDTPNACGQGPEAIPVAEMRAIAGAAIDGASGVSATFDGQALNNIRRVRSRVFELTLPEDNLFDAACADTGGLPGGVYPTAVDDGYYALLKPLRPGNHTLRIQAEVPEAGFVIDTTYHLIAVPVH